MTSWQSSRRPAFARLCGCTKGRLLSDRSQAGQPGLCRVPAVELKCFAQDTLKNCREGLRVFRAAVAQEGALPELRKDPITGRWVISSTDRAQRPHDFVREVLRIERK